ncbi:hypothetical protein DL93DRAFT_2098566 [Clavulina sp. PMI_390]|nr:hypothetical protein DL93DRAFT_2098566 [Clavulina sp. PMI_390]
MDPARSVTGLRAHKRLGALADWSVFSCRRRKWARTDEVRSPSWERSASLRGFSEGSSDDGKDSPWRDRIVLPVNQRRSLPSNGRERQSRLNGPGLGWACLCLDGRGGKAGWEPKTTTPRARTHVSSETLSSSRRVSVKETESQRQKKLGRSPTTHDTTIALPRPSLKVSIPQTLSISLLPPINFLINDGLSFSVQWAGNEIPMVAEETQEARAHDRYVYVSDRMAITGLNNDE